MPKPPPKPDDLTQRVVQLEQALRRLQADVTRLGDADAKLVARRIVPLEAAVRALAKHVDQIEPADVAHWMADIEDLIEIVLKWIKQHRRKQHHLRSISLTLMRKGGEKT